MEIINLILLYIVFVIVLTLVKNHRARIVSSIILFGFFALEVFSVLVGGDLIDYKFYVHSNLKDIFITKGFYLKEVLICLLIFVGSVYSSSLIQSRLKRRFWLPKLAIITVGFVVFIKPGGVFFNLWQAAKVINSKVSLDFYNDVSVLGFEDYPYRESIQVERVKKGKRIIVLSLESYESAFLEEGLNYLTPNLRRLKNEWSYVEMSQNEGSGWTSGSLYTALTGFPAFFKGNGNYIFDNAESSKVNSLPEILKCAGYTNHLVVGNAEFSGTRSMVSALGVDSVWDYKKLLGKKTHSSFGLHDKDLFDGFKKVLEKETHGQNFYFVSTVSTHNPNGVYDKRLKSKVSYKGRDLKYMIEGVDYLVGDLIDFLASTNKLENTLIYIFPDHLKHGSDRMFGGEKRSLYMLSNSPKKDLLKTTKPEYYQIDIPKMILDGSGIVSNCQFLSDIIQGDKNQFINNHCATLTSLNTNGIQRNGYWTNDLTLCNQEGGLLLDFETNKQFIRDVGDSTMLLFNSSLKYKGYLSSDFEDTKATYKILIVKKGNLLQAVLNHKLNKPVALGCSKRLVIHQTDIEKAESAPLLNNSRVFWYGFKDSLITYSGDWKDVRYSLDIPYCLSKGMVNISYQNNSKNSPSCELWDYANFPYDKPELIKLVQLDPNLDSCAFEFSSRVERPLFRFTLDNGDSMLVKEIVIDGKGTFCPNSDSPSNKKKRLRDTSRFIAHGGGQIDGVYYTNSLEALNLSYEKGFRFFELDLRPTKGGELVAVHEWRDWKDLGEVQLEGIPTHEEFMSQKVFGKYTPLDMVSIVDWFREHQDAILVTDKINDPLLVFEKFPFHERLMMEIFSIDAARVAAKNSKSKTILSSCAWVGIPREKRIDVLKSLNIEYLGMPISGKNSQMDFVTRAKREGIKTYIWGVGMEGENSTHNVIEFYMPYIYGYYADYPPW